MHGQNHIRLPEYYSLKAAFTTCTINGQNQGCIWPCTIKQNIIYRVSIKSFPDYKHLLQENDVEYKHIIFFFKIYLNSRSLFTTHQYTSTCAPFVARRTSNR